MRGFPQQSAVRVVTRHKDNDVISLGYKFLWCILCPRRTSCLNLTWTVTPSMCRLHLLHLHFEQNEVSVWLMEVLWLKTVTSKPEPLVSNKTHKWNHKPKWNHSSGSALGMQCVKASWLSVTSNIPATVQLHRCPLWETHLTADQGKVQKVNNQLLINRLSWGLIDCGKTRKKIRHGNDLHAEPL